MDFGEYPNLRTQLRDHVADGPLGGINVMRILGIAFIYRLAAPDDLGPADFLTVDFDRCAEVRCKCLLADRAHHPLAGSRTVG
jgi:hypothetical protein